MTLPPNNQCRLSFQGWHNWKHIYWLNTSWAISSGVSSWLHFCFSRALEHAGYSATGLHPQPSPNALMGKFMFWKSSQRISRSFQKIPLPEPQAKQTAQDWVTDKPHKGLCLLCSQAPRTARRISLGKVGFLQSWLTVKIKLFPFSPSSFSLKPAGPMFSARLRWGVGLFSPRPPLKCD